VAASLCRARRDATDGRVLGRHGARLDLLESATRARGEARRGPGDRLSPSRVARRTGRRAGNHVEISIVPSHAWVSSSRRSRLAL
jgi:hypothetical protein